MFILYIYVFIIMKYDLHVLDRFIKLPSVQLLNMDDKQNVIPAVSLTSL